MRFFGFFLAVLAAAMFGLGAVLAKILGQGIDAVSTALFSLGGGGVLLALCLLLARRPLLSVIVSLTRVEWGQLCLLAIVGTALPLLFIVAGFTRTGAIEGGFVLQLNGVAALIFGLVLLHERIRWLQGIGIALLLLGSGLVIVRDTTHVSLGNGLPGDVFILLGTLGLGFGFVPARRLAQRVDALSVTALRLLLGSAFLLPIFVFQALFQPGAQFWHITPTILWALPCYILTNFCLAYVAQQEGLRQLQAWEMGAIMQTVPIFSTLTAILLLSESLTPLQVVGALIVLVGGVVVSLA